MGFSENRITKKLDDHFPESDKVNRTGSLIPKWFRYHMNVAPQVSSSAYVIDVLLFRTCIHHTIALKALTLYSLHYSTKSSLFATL